MDLELVDVVHRWVALWTGGLADGGVPAGRIYTHIASLGPIARSGLKGLTDYLHDQHAPPLVAFNAPTRPGFTVYSSDVAALDGSAIQGVFTENGSPHWAMAEGMNAAPSGQAANGGTTFNSSPMSWEQYLATFFNHGATLVNVYGWDPDTGPGHTSPAASADALYTYQTFLSGAPLTE
jgi:hypothetical protein